MPTTITSQAFAKLSIALIVAAATSTVSAQPMPVWQNGLVQPNGDAGMLFMGEKGGFGKAFGLDIKTVSLRGDPLLLKALISGQIDSYIGGPASPLVAASKGGDIKIVGCGWIKQSYVLWGNASIKAMADLRGKTLGISTPGSAPDIFIRAALRSNNINPEDVNFAAAGMPSDWLKSMAAGVIQGSATPDEYEIRGKQMGLKVLTTSEKATPLSMQRCYFGRNETLRDHPDRLVKFLAAEMAAYQFSLANREPTITLTRQILDVDDKQPEATASYDSIVARNVIDLSFEPPMDKRRWLRDVLAENGQLDAKWDPEKMIERGPLTKARSLFAAEGKKAAAGAPAALAAK
jgi:NitT/TauT family transport system substrate-binding protein